MDVQPRPKPWAPGLVAVALWLVSFGLGLQAIYDLTQLISVLRIALGASAESARLGIPVSVFMLALGFLVFLIWSTEYHIKRVGKPESWRLFGWTIGIELVIILLSYLI